MQKAETYPLARERNLILAVLVVFAALAWILLVWQWREMGQENASMTMSGQGMALTMGLTAPLYIGLWAAMMVAIMFPSAAPMILTFARVQAVKRGRGQVFVQSWLFVGAYIVLWSATSFIAYLAAVGGDELAKNWAWLNENGGPIAGIVLVLAGVYQLTPLKHACLSKCRTPVSFILGSWREGRWGAIRMGVEHAAYCLGCCWMLFVILFPLGMMNIAAMAVITLFIFAEKTWAIGRRVGQAGALVLIAYGGLVVLLPNAVIRL